MSMYDRDWYREAYKEQKRRTSSGRSGGSNKTGMEPFVFILLFIIVIQSMLGLKRDGMIMGSHSFRRNAITDTVNATNGNVELAAQIYGNSPRVVKGNYLTGYDVEAAVNALNTRNLTQ